MTADYSQYATWKGWVNQGFGSFDAAAAAYFSLELRQSGISHLEGLRILELGFGNGAFAAWAYNAGAEYAGIELIGALVDLARERGFDAKLADASDDLASAGQVDAVVAFDVFEHLSIEDLRLQLCKVHSCLRSGGRLIARVPSGDSPFSRSIQYGDLTHQTVLGSSAIVQLAEQAGLFVQAVRAPAFPLRGLGVKTFLRRLVINCVREALFFVISKALMGGGRPVLTPNLVFVLVKP